MNLWTFLVQNRGNVADLTVEHLWMVGISTLIAVAIGIPLGILIARRPVLRRPVIATANIIQTVPSLANAEAPEPATFAMTGGALCFAAFLLKRRGK